MINKKVRVRFAPSPTGPLHIGGLRTALFNYLFAKHHNGSFILRIEDTDLNRFVPGAEQYIVESLEWAGILPDEGISNGGPYAPYRQSERKGIYREYAEKLVDSGNAYYAFDTAEELDILRKEYEFRKQTFVYNAEIRNNMQTSIGLTREQILEKLKNVDKYVIRFKFNPGEEIIMHDLIRGEVRVLTNNLDDKILFKSDGMPTYHLANVVDDHLMNISHVIRGEEWLPSLSLHVSLYKAFGWEETMPDFAHLPLILKPDGKGKLSKRDGDKGGFPVFPLEWKDPVSGEISSGYRESGYFPEACINNLALLGWNPGTEQELFSLHELVKTFSLEKVGKSGSKFDPEKARWFNHQYLQSKPNDEIVIFLKNKLITEGIYNSLLPLDKIVGIVKERLFFISDIWEQTDFFFIPPSVYDESSVKKHWKQDTSMQMQGLIEVLSEIHPFEAGSIEKKVKDYFLEKNLGMGQIMNAWRIAIVGTSKGPGLAEISEILGKKEVLDRIKKAIETLK